MNFVPLAIGIALDVFDWLGVGLVPILGDVVDVAGTLYFAKVIGPIGFGGFLEIIPLADILPIFSLFGVIAMFNKKGRGR